MHKAHLYIYFPPGTNLLGGGDSVQSISLDGVPANVTGVASATSITVTMNDFSNRIDFFLGSVYILAVTGAVVSGGVYSHQMSGTVTDIDPRTGREGTRIIITGVNLPGYGNEVTAVTIAGVQGEIMEQISDSEIVVRAGAATGATSGRIKLMSDTGAIVISPAGLVFTYTEPGVILEVDPSEGAEGSGVLIQGTSLKPVGTVVTSVTIGGSPVSRIVTESESEVSVIVGPAPDDGGSNETIVIMANDGSLVRGGNFSYLNLSLSLPDVSSGQLGTRVLLRLPDDDAFVPSPDLVARIGEQTAAIISLSVVARTIEVAAPRAGEVGSYSVDVSVEGIDGRVARIRDGFTYIEEGVIFSMNPNRGQMGTLIRVEGRNLLGGGAAIQTARVGVRGGQEEVTANVTSSDDEVVEMELLENLPSGTPFPLVGDITLIADTGATIIGIGLFTLVQPGVISSVTPTQGQFVTVVTISGSDLLQGGTGDDVLSISLAGTEVFEILDSPSPPNDGEITVQANTSTETGPGEVIITLITGATIITPSFLSFQYLPPGIINTVVPAIGTVGTRVTISGENLLGGGIVDEISLGGTPSDVLGTPTNSLIEVRARESVESSGVVEILIGTGAVISGGEWEYEELGMITSFSPAVGQQGVSVVITGSSLLGSSAGEFTSCSLAGVPGTVTQSLNNEARCTAGFNEAAGRDTNPSLLSGPVQLLADSGPVITSEDDFSYYVAFIEEIDPVNGTNGTFVTITGQNLAGSDESGDTDVDFVTFGTVSTLSSATEVLDRDSVRVRVNPSLANNESLTVRLQLQSGVFLELEDAWEYTTPGEITSLSPSSALPGENVTVTGTDLVPPCVSDVTVVVGQTTSYEATIISTSEISFRPGPYQARTDSDANLDEPSTGIPIQIISSNGATVYSDSVLFAYELSMARVAAISPTAGSSETEVRITGTDLLSGGSEAVRVTLAGVDAAVVNSSDTEVIVKAMAGPEEGSIGRVIIESDNGQVSGIGTDVWHYLPQITAADVSPQTGQAGTRVSIDLKGVPLTITGVFLAGVRAVGPVSVSRTRVVVEASPSPATALTDIRVEFEGDGVLTVPDSWIYLDPVDVTSLTPDRGYFNTMIMIRGANFQAGGRLVDYVEVAGLSTDIISQTDTDITARVAEYVDSSANEVVGLVHIVSVDGAEYMSDSIEFTYVRLEVTGVSPSTGQGGTVVSVTGVGLLAGSSGSQPLLSAQLAGVDVRSVLTLTDTRIDLVASSSPTATDVGNITYTVNDGGSVIISDAWSYLQPGLVADVTPLDGVQGSYVTIRGERMLQGGSTVSEVIIAGVPVMEVVAGEDDFIQVRLGLTPGEPSGSISIESDTGALLESTSFTFQYLPSGSISSIAPSSGQNGTRVEIFGSRFTAFGALKRVSLAGVEAIIGGEVIDSSLTVEAGRPDTFEEFSGEVVIEAESGEIITGSPEFTYRQEGVIYIANPPRGLAGTRVTIGGEGLFGGGSSLDAVYLAGIEAMVDESSSNDSTVIVTASESSFPTDTLGDIVLISNTGAYVRKIGAWSYATPGDIFSIVPSQGQHGTEIRITGMGLLAGADSATQIVVGSVVTTDISTSTDLEIEARMGEPPTTDNFTDTVTLISNYGGEFPSTFTWTYLESSAVISALPMSGVGGDTVTVNGQRLFGGGTSIRSVETAGVEAMSIDHVLTNDNTVVFTVDFHPTGAAVQGDIVIESNTGALTIIENGWAYDSACPVGQFGDVGNCQDCSEECVTCNGPTDENCFSCNNFIVPLSNPGDMRCVSKCPNVSTLNNVCVDVCNSNQYTQIDSEKDAVFCYDCSDLCDDGLGCSGPDPTECTGCEVARDRDMQACVDACGVGTWLSQRECIPCHSQCETAFGCFGETSTDCNACRNVNISSIYSTDDDGSTSTVDEPQVIADICIESCPSGFYEEDDRLCLPCNDQCLGGCTGPTAFDCLKCASVARVQAGGEICVPSCNSGMTLNDMFEDVDGGCGECSRMCSEEDGCRGPTDSDCVSCRVNTDTGIPLPVFNGACLLICPNSTASASPKPSQYYYHNTTTGACEKCDSSCGRGCTGSSPDDCIEEDEPSATDAFSAGPGTIGITVSIIVIIAIVLAALVIFVIFFLSKSRGKRYKMDRDRVDRDVEEVEMNRYDRNPNETKESEVKGVSNEAFDEEYTLMSPGEPVSPTSPEHGPFVQVEAYNEVRASMIVDSSVTMIGNEDAELYCEAGAEAPTVPARPAKPPTAKPPKEQTKSKKPPAEKSRKTSATKLPPPKKSERPPPVSPSKSTSSTSVAEKKGKKPAPLPSGTDGEPEMYTDMSGSVQQVYIQPQDEEYSEMAHVPAVAAADEQLYEDTGAPETRSPQKQASDTALLLNNEDVLYEDTETTVVSSDYQKIKHAASASAIGSTAPDVPKQPIPRKRPTPLPQTPLEESIQKNEPQQPLEALYEATDAGAIPEESLYEAIPTHHSRPLPAEPSPNIPPKGQGRVASSGSNKVPLPPKGNK